MKTKFAFLALAGVSACGGAQETSGVWNAQQDFHPAPRSGTLPADVTDAVLNWSKCRSSKLVTLIDSALGDEEVVDKALSECRTFENATTNAWEKHFGPNSGGQVQDLRAQWRAGLVASVRQMRAGTTPAVDPAHGFGVCVGQKIQGPYQPNMTSETVVGSAIEACDKELQEAVAVHGEKFGSAAAQIYREQLRQQARKVALEMAETKPSPH